MTHPVNTSVPIVTENHVHPTPFRPWVIAFVNVQALIYGGVIVWLAFNIGKPLPDAPVRGTHFAQLNLLIALLGSCVGWLIGTLASPYNKDETSRFVTYSHAISAFVSGYLLSKLDPLITSVIQPGGPNAFDSASWERLGLFAASLIVMALIVYINRSYFDPYRGFSPPKLIKNSPDQVSVAGVTST